MITLEEHDALWKKRPLFVKIWSKVRYRFPTFRDYARRIKWFIQRGRRGYSDCDTWNMYSYLIRITLPMLRWLRTNNAGYPGYGKASTPEKWDTLLDEMIEGFEAAKRIEEWDFKDYEEYVADQKLFQKKMKVFSANPRRRTVSTTLPIPSSITSTISL